MEALRERAIENCREHRGAARWANATSLTVATDLRCFMVSQLFAMQSVGSCRARMTKVCDGRISVGSAH